MCQIVKPARDRERRDLVNFMLSMKRKWETVTVAYFTLERVLFHLNIMIISRIFLSSMKENMMLLCCKGGRRHVPSF